MVVAVVAGMLVAQFVPAASVAAGPDLARLPPAPPAGRRPRLVVLLVDVFGPEGIAPFIYFQF